MSNVGVACQGFGVGLVSRFLAGLRFTKIPQLCTDAAFYKWIGITGGCRL